MNIYYAVGLCAIIAGITIMVYAIKKRKLMKSFLFGVYLIYSLSMLCFGWISIIFKTCENISAILFGLFILVITYEDRNKFTPGMNYDYIGYLKGYVGGGSFILWGLVRILSILIDGEPW